MDAITLANTLGGAYVPEAADVILLQQPRREQLQARARRFIAQLQEHGDCPMDNGSSWHAREDQTVIHLADGARAIVYHASGALRYVSGLAPMASPFDRATGLDELIQRIETRALKLNLRDWAGAHGDLRFERLFRRLAAGAHQSGKLSEVSLLRAIGAWRQFIGKIPVLGAASGALALAGSGQLDGLRVNIRPSNGEVLDHAPIIDPELGARQLLLRLASLLGQGHDAVPRHAIESAILQFGYLDLGKRKPQRVLAPAYVARIVLRHRGVRQGYVLAVAATEKPYLELPLFGSETVVTRGRTDFARCEGMGR
jgi:hypothetical protein